jgi:glycerol-3-phosphate dehydrogenase
MRRIPSNFLKQTYDLLVIGGGINGASIAHIAARRGMKVALVEKGDFAGGTSGRSTKLIHGGIRYLENLEFDLVYESLHERRVQLQAAPHLVKPLGILIPVYRGDKRPLWMMRLGVFLYDILAGSCLIRKHKALTAGEISDMGTGLEKAGLTGGVIYYDAQMDDFRLCLENVLAAADAGADVANYMEVVSYIKEGSRTAGVTARDLLDGTTLEIRAKQIVCAAGPWTNGLLRMDHPKAPKKVRMTKGIHLVCRGQVSKYGLLISSKSDNRIFFVLPWMGNSLIGTTDTNYAGNPDKVAVDQEDIDYLLAEARRVFPGADFGSDKILASFAGLRPLIRRGGSPTKVSRKHMIYRSRSGVLFVVGGKYTTYRKVACDCVDKFRRGPYGMKGFQLRGMDAPAVSVEEIARQRGVPSEIVSALMEKYGTAWAEVLDLAFETKDGLEVVSDNPLAIRAQIDYAVQIEMARTPDDVLRRLSLNFTDRLSEKCRNAVAESLKF